jgi:hypothetical protein
LEAGGWWSKLTIRASNVKSGYDDYATDLDRRRKNWEAAATRLLADYDNLSPKEAIYEYLHHGAGDISAVLDTPREGYVFDRIGQRPRHFLLDIGEAWAAFLTARVSLSQSVQKPLPVAMQRLALETGTEVPGYAAPAGTDWRYTSGPLPKLYGVGNANKARINWGGFQEENLARYIRGNQWDPDFAGTLQDRPIAIYEYYVDPPPGTPGGMSKVASQPTVDFAAEPKIQYYNPEGLGAAQRGRLLGIVKPEP